MVDVRMAAAFGIIGMLLVGGIAAEATDTINVIPERPDEPDDNQTDDEEDEGLPFTPNLSSGSGELNVSENIQTIADSPVVPTPVEFQLSNLEKDTNYTIIGYNNDEKYKEVSRFNSGSSGLQIVNDNITSNALLQKEGYLFQLYSGGQKVTNFHSYPELTLFKIDTMSNGDVDSWETDSSLTSFNENGNRLRGYTDIGNAGKRKLTYNHSIKAERAVTMTLSSSGSGSGYYDGQPPDLHIGDSPFSASYGSINVPKGKDNYTLHYDEVEGRMELRTEDGLAGSTGVAGKIDEYYISFKLETGGTCCSGSGNSEIKVHEMGIVPRFGIQNWESLRYNFNSKTEISNYDATDSTPSEIRFRNNQTTWTNFPSQLGESEYVEFGYNGDPEKFEIAVMKSESSSEDKKSLLNVFGFSLF